ncbi:hypothetical protein [Pontibacter mangrovi]|uniref:Uncharacterized protein n=1 Tax=Pontibacter mangrovi TaxID=2589816 RepID=A0A501WD64_9BACT|nr:hypothetical protein [Pontibacter mangrovi]TPE45141.1 hypothetical protein FJM65_03610 [Pontibacter mangrovi]
MKHTLYVILCLALLSCQNQENQNEQTTPVTTPAPDTAAAVAQPAPPPTPDPAYLIKPGESIGKIELGMPGTNLAKILGEPDSTDAAMGKALLFWVDGQEYVALYTVADFGGKDERPKVQQVQVTSPAFKTADGIGTGKALPEIRRTYSGLQPLAYYQNAQQQQVYIFDDRQQGIAFEVTLPDSTCTAITIHPKGESMTDAYLPLHPDMTRIGRQ